MQGWGFDGFMAHEINERLLREARASRLGKLAGGGHRSGIRRLFEVLGRKASGVEAMAG